jgi:hypothetical protein
LFQVEQDEPGEIFGQNDYHRRSAETCQEYGSSLQINHAARPTFVDDVLPSAVLFDNAVTAAAATLRFLGKTI